MHLPAEPPGQFLHHLGNACDQLRTMARRDALGAFGLSLADWLVLEGLFNLKVATQRDLTEPTRLDKVAINRAVARLRETDLIIISPNTSDGRSHLIELAPKGVETFHAASSAIQSMEHRVLAQFSAQEANQIRHLISKLTQVVAMNVPDLDIPKETAPTVMPSAFRALPARQTASNELAMAL